MAKTRRKLTICSNCSQTLAHHENFCPNCGQENHDKQATTVQLANDFVEDYVGFDNKFFRSIVPLLIKPGEMTVEFLDGKRKKFISPIRLFIFTTFIYFALYLWLYSDWEGAVTINGEMASEDKEQLFIESFQNNLNLIAFFFVPIQSWIIMALFWSPKRRFYVNYFVFTLHLFSFLLVLGITAQLVHLLFLMNDSILMAYAELAWIGLLLIYVLFYSIIALKKVFERKYNIIRFAVVLVLSIIVFLLLALLFILFFVWFYDIS